MKNKYKVSDVTKFTIALGLCLSVILVSIVLVNVFTHQEKSAKAETISDDGYSFATYDHSFDAELDSFYIASNDPSSDYWQNTFLYLTYNGEPFVLPHTAFYKTNFTIDVDFYNPNNCNITEVVLGDTATDWGNRFVSKDILSTDTFIRGHYEFDPFLQAFGSISFGNNTRDVYYITYVNVSLVYSGVSYNFEFGSRYFYDNFILQRSIGYNEGYDTALSDVGAFNTYGTDYVTTHWGSDLNAQFAPSNVRFSPISNNGYNIYSSGVSLTPDLWFGFEFDIDLVSGRTYTLNYNIYDNLDYSSDVAYSYGNIALGYSIGGNPTLITERPNYDDNTAGMIPLFNGYNGYSFTMNRNADQFLLLVRIGFMNTSGNESYVFSIDNLQLTSVLTYKDGYDKGFADGSSGSSSIVDTDSASYKQGYNNGNTAGYNRGYSEGVQNRYSFVTLFTAAIEAPINAVLNGFNVEILGMNLRNFYLSLFSLAIVIVVIKLILFRRN